MTTDIIYTLVKTPNLISNDDITNANLNPNLTDFVSCIRNNFDNIIDKNIYDNNQCYENLYKEFKKLFNNKLINKKFVNFSSDPAMSTASLSALNEIYSSKSGGVYSSDLKIIYIDTSLDMELNNYDNLQNINSNIASKSIISNLISLSQDDIKRSYTKHVIDFELSQFIFLGVEQLSPFEENLLLESKSKYYTLNIIFKKLEQILDNIIEDNKDKPIAIIFDFNIFNSKLKLNCVNRSVNQTKCGINMDQLNLIIHKLSKLSENIKMIDITGFSMYFDQTTNNEQLKSNIDVITKIYSQLLHLKEYSLNIFTENTRFLIYKPMEEIYDIHEKGDNTIGWYLLRNIPLSIKCELLDTLDSDSIIILDILDDDNNEVEIMISTTSINDQNEKCYYLASSYKDCCLYPDEKLDMMFELINC